MRITAYESSILTVLAQYPSDPERESLVAKLEGPTAEIGRGLIGQPFDEQYRPYVAALRKRYGS